MYRYIYSSSFIYLYNILIYTCNIYIVMYRYDLITIHGYSYFQTLVWNYKTYSVILLFLTRI